MQGRNCTARAVTEATTCLPGLAQGAAGRERRVDCRRHMLLIRRVLWQGGAEGAHCGGVSRTVGRGCATGTVHKGAGSAHITSRVAMRLLREEVPQPNLAPCAPARLLGPQFCAKRECMHASDTKSSNCRSIDAQTAVLLTQHSHYHHGQQEEAQVGGQGRGEGGSASQKGRWRAKQPPGALPTELEG